MKKIIIRRSKMQLICGQAKPGASLSFLKNMVAFCKDFNAKTSHKKGVIVNIEIKVYHDNSYSYETKNTPVSLLIKNILNEKKEINDSDISKIVSETKTSFNTNDEEKIKKTISGILRSFNIK